MATIQDILAINNYRGQGYAGGNVAVSVDLNTSQLNQVAQLTYYQNKDRYERNNKLKDEAAGILAEQMATDVSSVDPKIAKLLLDKKNAIGEMAENSFAFNRDKDPELFIKMEKEIGDLTNLVGANKKNQFIYNQEKKRIDGLTDLAEREREQEKFDLTNKIYYEDGEKNLRDGIYLGYEAPPQPISFGDFVGNMVEYDVFEKGANNDLVYTHKILDQASTEAQLRKIGAGLEIPKYKPDPSLSQDKNRLKELALAASYKNGVRQTMQNTDELLKSSDPTTLKRTTSEIENFNAQVERYNELLRTGELKDKKGNVLNKGYVGNFKPITLEKTTNADGTESYFLDDYEKAALALFNSGKFKLIDEVKVKNDYTAALDNLTITREKVAGDVAVAKEKTKEAGVKGYWENKKAQTENIGKTPQEITANITSDIYERLIKSKSVNSITPTELAIALGKFNEQGAPKISDMDYKKSVISFVTTKDANGNDVETLQINGITVTKEDIENNIKFEVQKTSSGKYDTPFSSRNRTSQNSSSKTEKPSWAE